MKKTFIVLFFVLVHTLAYSQIRLAIVELRAGVERGQEQVDGLADMLSTELYKTGNFVLVERNLVSKILEELSFQNAGALSSEQRSALARKLNVEAILTGTINFKVTHRDVESYALGMETGDYSVDLRIVSVETGEIISTAGGVKQGNTTEHYFFQQLASKLSDNLRLSKKQQTVKCLFGYLYTYPSDLGAFTTYPSAIINAINKASTYGYNDWRLPTEEELELLTFNASEIGISNVNNKYATNKTEFNGYNTYRVRLIRTGVVVEQSENQLQPYLEADELDFGRISAIAGKVTKQIKVNNPSKSPIFIENVKAVATYLKTNWSNNIIDSGGYGTISVTILSAKKRGSSINQKVTVYTSDGSALELRIKAIVE